MCSQLVELLELTPYSRAEFKTVQGELNQTDDILERARMLFVAHNQSRSGHKTSGWKSSTKNNASVNEFRRKIKKLQSLSVQLQNIQIENLDYKALLERYDNSNALHYFDPPYARASSVQPGRYRHELTKMQHTELVSIILDLKGLAILSGHENLIYKKLEEDGGFKKVKLTDTEHLWISPNKTKRRKNLGVMQLDSKTTGNRYVLGAEYTQHVRKTRTEQRIKMAIASLQQQSKSVSKASVGRLCNISREQISRRYSYLFSNPKK